MKISEFLNKNIAPYVLMGSIALGAAGCGVERRTELTDIVHEKATVTQKHHEDSWVQLMPMQVGKVTTLMPINHAETNMIYFSGPVCFEIDDKAAYGKFQKGDEVELSYVAVYKLKLKDTNKDGIKELIKREFKGYRFVDAQKTSQK